MTEDANYWKIRPLTPSMIGYASEDVLYLCLVHRQMNALLDRNNKKIVAEKSMSYVVWRQPSLFLFLSPPLTNTPTSALTNLFNSSFLFPQWRLKCATWQIWAKGRPSSMASRSMAFLFGTLTPRSVCLCKPQGEKEEDEGANKPPTFFLLLCMLEYSNSGDTQSLVNWMILGQQLQTLYYLFVLKILFIFVYSLKLQRTNRELTFTA